MKSKPHFKKFIARILLGVPNQNITFNWKVFGLVFLIDIAVWSVMVLLFEKEEDNDKGKF